MCAIIIFLYICSDANAINTPIIIILLIYEIYIKFLIFHFVWLFWHFFVKLLLSLLLL